jgi:hypothetical protein
VSLLLLIDDLINILEAINIADHVGDEGLLLLRQRQLHLSLLLQLLNALLFRRLVQVIEVTDRVGLITLFLRHAQRSLIKARASPHFRDWENGVHHHRFESVLYVAVLNPSLEECGLIGHEFPLGRVI